MDKRAKGRLGEGQAIRYLKKIGYTILETNFTCKIGEIDIIAADGHTIVFIEVKSRKDCKKGRPFESVGYHKKKKIIKTAMVYAKNHKVYDRSLRFDVVEIIDDYIKVYKNAFPFEMPKNYL